MDGAVSKAGITADLEAMKQAGLEGAYLMPIRGVPTPPLFEHSAELLTPEWWALVRHAFAEADRLGLKLALHASSGWSAAGGPWITPAQSMQRVTWSSVAVEGGKPVEETIPQPSTKLGYYRDIAVLAWKTIDPVVPPPSPRLRRAGIALGEGLGAFGEHAEPTITTAELGGKAVPRAVTVPFSSAKPCWVQYAFAEPFTLRSLVIRPGGGNYEANRLLVSASDDGVQFHPVKRLEAPRHGWQDDDADVTHSIPATTAKYFRFTYDPEGSEPGAEDLDSAKWITGLNLSEIALSSEARINQFEGKSGQVWRLSAPTAADEVTGADCVPVSGIVDLTSRLGADGHLAWTPPPGRWTIFRVGHTATGHTNAKGGAAEGLECDKLSAGAARGQFDHWFGEAIRQVGPELAGRVLKIFHIDSWECGSQNWTDDFRAEFQRRRGYDLLPWLPVMAGLPVQSVDQSERVLRDMRETIAELIADRFYPAMAEQAHRVGCQFSAESVAPTMISDGMLHFQQVDLPQGEFWLRSVTNDKITDILDAVSGARIYAKNIVQAEAFTELQIGWDEHPALLKALADRNFCYGVNRFVFHVFTENPWTDRRPGMTLDGVGSFFQRDQTWWKPGRAWIDYVRRCEALLQEGHPVADLAVFTGEDVPRRAVIPAQLISTLPGLFRPETKAREAQRMANRGVPLTESPEGNVHTAISDPGDWVDALQGYAYDSINPDALLRLAAVRDGRIVLPGGASYAVLVVPGPRPMAPSAAAMSPEVARKIQELVAAGATVILGEGPRHSPSLSHYPEADAEVQQIAGSWGGARSGKELGRGRVLTGPYAATSLAELGVERDFIATDRAAANSTPSPMPPLAWTHRTLAEAELYFISNPSDTARTVEVSLRSVRGLPEVWDPVTLERRAADHGRIEAGRTRFTLELPANGSVFVVERVVPNALSLASGPSQRVGDSALHPLSAQLGAWSVAFDPAFGGPAEPLAFARLESWSRRPETGVRYYSGTAVYSTTLDWQPRHTGRPSAPRRVWLDLGRVANLGEVSINGIPCGVAWTPPYRLEVTAALRPGTNELKIAVTNTWLNRLKGDHDLPPAQRITATTNAPYRLGNKSLLDAGLLGPVTLCEDEPRPDEVRQGGARSTSLSISQ
jgi:hypothetical protein